jgi:hypothetical protein
MEKEFIPYEQALALKELGFDEPCFGYYYSMDNKKIGLEMYIDVQHQDTYFVQAPLYQQAFRWFREKHNLDSWVKKSKKDDYIFEIFNWGKDSWDFYEEAELECLKKLIEIVKSKL